MEVRKSLAADEFQIECLFSKCFGDPHKDEACVGLHGRYLLLYENDHLVSMTGLCRGEGNRLEVDWTCTMPGAQHRGYMSRLFRELLTEVHEPLYYSAWRLPDNTIPASHLLYAFQFHRVREGDKWWKYGVNCFRDLCAQRDRGGCACYEDLYVRDVPRPRPLHAGRPIR